MILESRAAFARAEQAAQVHSDSQAVGVVTAPCSKSLESGRQAIEVKVVGEDGTGLNGIGLLLTRGDAQVLTGKTGPVGLYRFNGLEPDTYHLRLPELDKDAWLMKTIQAMPELSANCTGTASWKIASAPQQASVRTHVVKQGECVGKIAEYYGFSPKTIWDYPANVKLKNQRGDNLYILLSGDQVAIPIQCQKALTVSAGELIVIIRQGVPERLRIRFLKYDGSPKVAVPYLLTLTTADQAPIAHIMSQTDGDGFVDQSIPPSAVFVTIFLGKGHKQEVHNFNLGFVNPIDTLSGIKARLNNLGYDCGEEGEGPQLTNKTIAAIKAFQKSYKLAVSGECDQITVNVLKEKFGS